MREDAYKRAGVDIDAQTEALRRIREHVAAARTAAVVADLGAFGGLYDWDGETLLVATTDGLGTKLKLGRLRGRYDTLGEDLVHHCVNDLLVQGAEPLFFLDYIALDRMEPEVAAGLVAGMSRALRAEGAALLGGELAEMPGVYREGLYDVAGFLVGRVRRGEVLPRGDVRPGDLLVGLASTGLHTNGYSLALKVLVEEGPGLEARLPGVEGTVGEALAAVHRSYRPLLRPFLGAPWLKALAHVTGGGLRENLPRVLPPGAAARIEAGSWPVPALFRHLVHLSGMTAGEAARVFNLGIGMVAVVDPAGEELLTGAAPYPVYRIGRVVEGGGDVILAGDLEAALKP